MPAPLFSSSYRYPPYFGGLEAAPLPLTDLPSNPFQEGLELGDASDRVFSKVNSKHHDGTVGLLTAGAIGRSAYYQHAITLALAPFLDENAWLYE